MSAPPTEAPDEYSGTTTVVSEMVLFDHIEHMQEAHDIDKERAEEYFEDVMTHVMFLEQSLPEVDWDQDEIEVITNTLLGLAHQDAMMEQRDNSPAQQWADRIVTTLLLSVIALNAYDLGTVQSLFGTEAILNWVLLLAVMFLFLVVE